MYKRWNLFILTICIILSLAATPIAVSAPPVAKTYAGEKVTELHSLDYESRTYQHITKDQDISDVLSLLQGYTPPPAAKQPDSKQCGFLIFTEKGKHTVYLPSTITSQDKRTIQLYELSKKLNMEYPRHVQWFSYMSTEKIQSIEFEGTGGKGYTNKDYKYTFGISVKTTDLNDIEKAATFLKKIEVNAADSIYPKGERNPGMNPDAYRMVIHFDNGISYTCYGPFLSISSSDIPDMVTYSEPTSVSVSQIKALQDLMAEMSQAKLTY